MALAIKSDAPEVQIIMLTGFSDLINEVGEKPPGVDAVLGEPVQFALITETIAMLTQKREGVTA